MLAGLAALPERDRAVIELVDIAGLRPQEAAAALGLAPGTVRMRLLRARARLRKDAQQQQTLRKHPTTTQTKVTAMTKFEDQLFDDLMREHGSTLTNARPPAAEAARRDPPGAAGGRRGRRRRRGRGRRARGHRRQQPGQPASSQVAGRQDPGLRGDQQPRTARSRSPYTRKPGSPAPTRSCMSSATAGCTWCRSGPGCPSMASLPAPAVSLNGKHLEHSVERVVAVRPAARSP